MEAMVSTASALANEDFALLLKSINSYLSKIHLFHMKSIKSEKVFANEVEKFLRFVFPGEIRREATSGDGYCGMVVTTEKICYRSAMAERKSAHFFFDPEACRPLWGCLWA